MGNYRVVVEATGGHGCQRESGDGEKVFGCRRMDCPDCITQEYILKMKTAGQSINKATLIHWPGEMGEVVDEFVGPSKNIEEYEKSIIKDGEVTKTGEIARYISEIPIHRIRHGNFPDRKPKGK